MKYIISKPYPRYSELRRYWCCNYWTAQKYNATRYTKHEAEVTLDILKVGFDNAKIEEVSK